MTISAALTVAAGMLVINPASADDATPSAPQPGFRTLDEIYFDTAKRVPGFAGVELDESGGTRVFLTQATQQRAVRAQTILSELWPQVDKSSPAVAVPVRYDFVQLKTWYDLFASEVFEVPSVVMTDIDEGSNRLYVGISDVKNTQAVHDLAELRGIPADVVHVGYTEPVVQNLQARRRPLVGGLQIGYSGFLCSLGFVANYSGIDGFLTNSHCTRVQGGTEGTSYGQPNLNSGNVIGSEVADPALFTGGGCPSGYRCRWSDAAFINHYASVTSSRGYVARTATAGNPTWNGSNRLQIRSKWDHPPLGTPVGKTGRTTGTTRGVVNNTCVNVISSGTNVMMLCQGRASYLSAGGDSGSGVWEESTGTASGLHWGAGGIFSPWGNIEYEFGTLSVCASGC